MTAKAAVLSLDYLKKINTVLLLRRHKIPTHPKGMRCSKVLECLILQTTRLALCWAAGVVFGGV